MNPQAIAGDIEPSGLPHRTAELWRQEPQGAAHGHPAADG